jgi:hypothetical protein
MSFVQTTRGDPYLQHGQIQKKTFKSFLRARYIRTSYTYQTSSPQKILLTPTRSI